MDLVIAFLFGIDVSKSSVLSEKGMQIFNNIVYSYRGFRHFMVMIFCFDDRTIQSSPLSVKDQEEKAKRCECVQGLLLSTIVDDIL